MMCFSQMYDRPYRASQLYLFSEHHKNRTTQNQPPQHHQHMARSQSYKSPKVITVQLVTFVGLIFRGLESLEIFVGLYFRGVPTLIT